MSHLFLRSLAALVCLGVFSLPRASAEPKPDQVNKPNFSGIWTLDLKESTSLEPLMKQLGTKQGKEGELIIKRYLINEGKSLVADYILKLQAEPHTSARQIWHKI